MSLESLMPLALLFMFGDKDKEKTTTPSVKTPLTGDPLKDFAPIEKREFPPGTTFTAALPGGGFTTSLPGQTPMVVSPGTLTPGTVIAVPPGQTPGGPGTVVVSQTAPVVQPTPAVQPGGSPVVSPTGQVLPPGIIGYDAQGIPIAGPNWVGPTQPVQGTIPPAPPAPQIYGPGGQAPIPVPIPQSSPLSPYQPLIQAGVNMVSPLIQAGVQAGYDYLAAPSYNNGGGYVDPNYQPIQPFDYAPDPLYQPIQPYQSFEPQYSSNPSGQYADF